MQDFHNALFIFFLIRNNKLTVNLIQIFFHKSFIEDINFFRIDVYPAIFFILFVVFACHEKIDVLDRHIWIFSRQGIDNLEWV